MRIEHNFKKFTFLFLVLKIWKGRIFCFSKSNATDSESRIHDFTSGPSESFKREIMSGYFEVLFSWLRLKMLTLPSSFKWICKIALSWRFLSVEILHLKQRKYWYDFSHNPEAFISPKCVKKQYFFFFFFVKQAQINKKNCQPKSVINTWQNRIHIKTIL